jgi:hypothetical protein
MSVRVLRQRILPAAGIRIDAELHPLMQVRASRHPAAAGALP